MWWLFPPVDRITDSLLIYLLLRLILYLYFFYYLAYLCVCACMYGRVYIVCTPPFVNGGLEVLQNQIGWGGLENLLYIGG